jgi:hypothetical protein
MSIAHTRVFYSALLEDDLSALSLSPACSLSSPCSSDSEGLDDPLSALLSPDCRVQNR